jgi:hypothetical protein
MRRHYMKNRPLAEKPPRPHSALTILFWASKCFLFLHETKTRRNSEIPRLLSGIDFRQELKCGYAQTSHLEAGCRPGNFLTIARSLHYKPGLLTD